jgi:hypothetical protein
MANLISSLTAPTFVFFLRHLPVSLLGIGKPLGTTSRSPFQFKYTSNIAAPPSLRAEHIAAKQAWSHPNTTAYQETACRRQPATAHEHRSTFASSHGARIHASHSASVVSEANVLVFDAKGMSPPKRSPGRSGKSCRPLGPELDRATAGRGCPPTSRIALLTHSDANSFSTAQRIFCHFNGRVQWQ